MVTTTKTKPKPDEFELDAILGKYATKPDPLATPELYLLYSQAGSGKSWLASSAVDVSPDTKVLYIDVEGSSPGVITNHKNWKNIDVIGRGCAGWRAPRCRCCGACRPHSAS